MALVCLAMKVMGSETAGQSEDVAPQVMGTIDGTAGERQRGLANASDVTAVTMASLVSGSGPTGPTTPRDRAAGLKDIHGRFHSGGTVMGERGWRQMWMRL